MDRRLLIMLTHGLGCLFFLTLPYLRADNGLANVRQLSTNPHEQRNRLSYVFAISFFYLNYFILIPRFFFPKPGAKFQLAHTLKTTFFADLPAYSARLPQSRTRMQHACFPPRSISRS